MRIITQVFGNNGSGKTTLLRRLAASDPFAHIKDVGEKVTVLPSLNQVLVGDYLNGLDRTTAGVDRLSPKSRILQVLNDTLANFPEYDVIWEGIIIMTRQYLQEYTRRGLNVRHVFLMAEVDTCLKRILDRSGKTIDQLKDGGQIIKDRHKAIEALLAWSSTLVPPAGQRLVTCVVRVDDVPADEVLVQFKDLLENWS